MSLQATSVKRFAIALFFSNFAALQFAIRDLLHPPLHRLNVHSLDPNRSRNFNEINPPDRRPVRPSTCRRLRQRRRRRRSSSASGPRSRLRSARPPLPPLALPAALL